MLGPLAVRGPDPNAGVQQEPIDFHAERSRPEGVLLPSSPTEAQLGRAALGIECASNLNRCRREEGQERGFALVGPWRELVLRGEEAPFREEAPNALAHVTHEARQLLDAGIVGAVSG